MKPFYKVAFIVLSFVMISFNEGFGQAPGWEWAKGSDKFAPINSQSLVQLMDSIVHWYWDSATGLKPNAKNTNFTYDASNNITGFLHQVWNGSTWIDYSRYTRTYDISNNLITELQEHLNNNVWYNYTLFTYNYNANNYRTNALYQSWYNNSWNNYTQYVYTYDINNNLTTNQKQTWLNNAWIGEHRYTYTYNVSAYPLTAMFEWYSSGWVKDWRSTFIYDANNVLISKLSAIWYSNSWNITSQGSYTYDINNNLLIIYGWGYTGNLDTTAMTIFTYDSNNNQLSRLLQTWNYDDSTWVSKIIHTHTYDANNFITSDAERDFDETGVNVNGGDSTRYYFHTGVLTELNEQTSHREAFTFYPNPTTNQITITVKSTTAIQSSTNATLSLYDITGRTILQQHFNTKATLDISTLTNGIYMVEIKDLEGRKMMGKVVKE